MARIIDDVQAIIMARFVGGSPVTGQDAAYAQIEDALRELRGGDFECEVSYETVARCDHCRARWTEDAHDYNGGCCAKDKAPGQPTSKAAAQVDGASSRENP